MRKQKPCPGDEIVGRICRRTHWPAPGGRPAWRKRPPPPTARRARSLRAGEALTQEEIAERLANPLRQVSEGELRAQYGYVIADLRSMGLLALGLFVLMILAALLL